MPYADPVDHIMPIALGGWHVLWNLAPSCRSCNTSKSDAHPMDWAERRASNRLSLVAIEKALRRHERNMRHAA